VDSSGRLTSNTPFHRLNAKSKLSKGQRPLATKASVSQARQVLFRVVFGAVDNPQVLFPPAFDGWLHETFFSTHDPVSRFDDHPFTPTSGQARPKDSTAAAGLRLNVAFSGLIHPNE
jgi:hypothetical protein